MFESVVPETHHHSGDRMIVDVEQYGGLAAWAAITVAAEVNDVRAVTIQLKRIDTVTNISYAQPFWLAVFGASGPTAMATTGGSTGMALAVDGVILPLVAKKFFFCTTEDTGRATFTWTDNSNEEVVLGVILPFMGMIFTSGAFKNAL